MLPCKTPGEMQNLLKTTKGQDKSNNPTTKSIYEVPENATTIQVGINEAIKDNAAWRVACMSRGHTDYQ